MTSEPCKPDIHSKYLLKVSSTLKHPPATLKSALALFLLINTAVNRTFSESLIVPDFCLFLLKSQNINAIQK